MPFASSFRALEATAARSSARRLVERFIVDNEGLAMVFDGGDPSIFVRDLTTSANNTDLRLKRNGLDDFSAFLTYTSPAIKNVMQPDGNIKYAAHNLFTNSNNLDGAFSNFNGNVTLTTQTGDTLDPFGESRAWKLEATATAGANYLTPLLGASPTFSVGSTYRWSIYAKKGIGTDYIIMTSNDGSGYYDAHFNIANGTLGTIDPNLDATIEDAGNGWYKCSLIYEHANGTSNTRQIRMTRTDSNYDAEIGDVCYMCHYTTQLYPADETFISTTDTDDDTSLGARYALPIQYASGTAEGLLVEPAATNLITDSQDFTAWTNFGTSDALDATGPDGVSSSATTITTSSGTGVKNISISDTTSNGTTYTISAYVKAGTHDFVYLSMGNVGNNVTAVFDLGSSPTDASETNTGATSGTVDSTLAEDVGGGWYRVSLTGSWSSGSSNTSMIGPAEAATGNSFASGGAVNWAGSAAGTETFIAYGVQVEANSVATSLVKTFGSTATRAFDNISKATSALPVDTSQSSLYVKYNTFSEDSSNGVASFVNSAGSNADFLRSTPSDTRHLSFYNSSGTEVALVDAGNITSGTTVKQAGGYEADNAAASVDGATVVLDNDTNGQTPETWTLMRVGANRAGSTSLHCLIKEIAYYPERLRNDYLEALTAGTVPTLWTDQEAYYAVQNETDALSLDFTDSYFKDNATSDFLGSAWVLDSGTPGNNFDGVPDDLLTYTTTSEKNILDSSGNLVYAPHNLRLYSSDFSDSSWTSGGALSVTITSGQTDPDGGSTAATITPASGSGAAYFDHGNITVISGATYTAEIVVSPGDYRYFSLFELNSGSSAGSVMFDTTAVSVIAANNGAATSDGSIESLGGGWYRCTYTFAATSTSINPRFFVDDNGSYSLSATGNASDSFTVAFPAVRNYPADTSYVPTTTAAVYGLPYDHYTSGTQRGLLVEPAATNLFAHSQDLRDATSTWADALNSVTTLDATGPDGVANSACTITDDAGTGSGNVVVQATVALSLETQYTWSLYAKADQLSWLCMRLSAFGTIPNDTETYFNLSAGTIGTADAGTDDTGIEDVGNGWYRCWIVFTTDAVDASGSLRIDVADGDNDRTVDRDGTSSILVYGAQLETGTVPTSLVKTYGATTARANDVVACTAGFPVNLSNMSVFYEGTLKDTSGNNYKVSVNDGSTNNRILIYASNSLLNSGGTNYNVSSLGGTFTTDTVHRAAIAAAANDLQAYFDGTGGTPDNTITMPVALNQIRIGCSVSGTSQTNGHIRKVIVLPRRVSNADLDSWTTTGDLP